MAATVKANSSGKPEDHRAARAAHEKAATAERAAGSSERAGIHERLAFKHLSKGGGDDRPRDEKGRFAHE